MTFGRLAMKAALLAALVAATLGPMLWIPASERTSYGAAIIDKQKRLESLPPGKVIFVGGSNLAFGLDSSLIETTLNRPVVNMGLHADAGLQFMLDQVRPHLSADDLVVLSLEYDLFFKEEALGQDACSEALYLQRPWRYIGYGGYARCQASTFVERVQHNFHWGLRRVLRLSDVPVSDVYNRKSFNRWGDVVAHISRPSEFQGPAPGPERIRGRPDDAMVEAILQFARFAKRRGARVVFLHPACAASVYAPRLDALRALDRTLRSRLEGDVVFLSTPEEFFFPSTMIFDTEFHLTGAGRQLRSRRVAAAILRLDSSGDERSLPEESSTSPM